MTELDGPPLGAVPVGTDACSFRVWAPLARLVALHLLEPEDRLVPVAREERGYHAAVVDGVAPGALYRYRLDDRVERPDPASRSQPRGVHGPSEVVDPSFPWTDAAWEGLPLGRCVFYELHVGAFTPEGTFRAAIDRLPALAELGVTALELMPVAQFPGTRGWGYDGVYPFAVQASYGGAAGLKALVDACHRLGLAVALDVVYNHFGPEGKYAAEFAPYFTDTYRTPWGPAVNFDGPGSDEVRRFFLDNALHWVRDFHVDALRVDAVHAILDRSAIPFLEELGVAVHAGAERLGRLVYVIAESHLNDPRLVRRREAGGLGLDAEWCDDFHHALHALLTGERGGYYRDFGEVAHLEKALREGYVLTGQRSEHYGRRHGRSAADLPPWRLVVYAQNHDQVGNRPPGERLSALVLPERLRLAAAATLLAPFLPLLFMGEEYGETAPFPYFVDVSDPALGRAVAEGRRREQAAFGWDGEPSDAGAEETFRSALLRPERTAEEPHAGHLRLHRELLRAREELRLRGDLFGPRRVFRVGDEGVLVVHRRAGAEPRAEEEPRSDPGSVGTAESLLLLNLSDRESEVAIPATPGSWRRRLDTAEPRFAGGFTPLPAALNSDGCLTTKLAPWGAALLLLGDSAPGLEPTEPRSSGSSRE